MFKFIIDFWISSNWVFGISSRKNCEWFKLTVFHSVMFCYIQAFKKSLFFQLVTKFISLSLASLSWFKTSFVGKNYFSIIVSSEKTPQIQR